jgi:hypothetical protein
MKLNDEKGKKSPDTLYIYIYIHNACIKYNHILGVESAEFANSLADIREREDSSFIIWI